jgi:hypothetical protein
VVREFGAVAAGGEVTALVSVSDTEVTAGPAVEAATAGIAVVVSGSLDTDAVVRRTSGVEETGIGDT